MTHTTEFWNNRLAATDPPLEASQTQIPHIPDQAEFLERWFEFHQGYRIVKHPGGTETRIAVIGEPFREVSPGFLPRTLDQLRAGRENDASRPENIFRRRRLTSEQDRPQQEQQTIEDALDDLLGELSDEEAEAEPVTETPATQIQDTNMPRRSSNGASSRPPTRTELRLQRARDRLVRVFGSREDVQRDDYESPLSTMYNRAEERYRQAEERRATGETSDPRLHHLNDLSRRERHELEEQILWGVLRDSRELSRQQNGSVASHIPPLLRRHQEIQDETSSHDERTPAPWDPLFAPLNDDTPSVLRGSLGHLSEEISRLQAATSTIASARLALSRQARHTHEPHSDPIQTLDEPSRPPPLTDAQMTLKLDCQVCYSQIADVALLPCGHMVMCQWCADIAVPVRHANIPVAQSKCPMCRRGVKQRVKIRVAGNDDGGKGKGNGRGKGGMKASVVSAEGVGAGDALEV